MTLVPPDNIAIFTVSALDDSGTSRAATGTITTSNYAAAYVARNSGGQIVLVTKIIPPAGSSVPVDVTVSGQDANGAALPDLVINFTLDGPPAPPVATHFSVSGMTVRDKIGYSVPADPGAASISF